jgi:cytochrome c biogenesis protein CcmG/thiol:disulfide interchange protein DsbE
LEGGTSLASLHAALLQFHNYVYAEFRLLTGQPPLRPSAPDFVLTDSTGKVVRLSDYRGKVVLLNFWATWCAPCKAEVPWFVDLQRKYSDDLVVLGVSFDDDGWSAVRPFLSERHVNYPVMLANPEMPATYQKVESLPTTFLIDRRGRIAGTHTTLASKNAYEEWVRSVF